MNRILAFIISLLVATSISAQEHTLLDGDLLFCYTPEGNAITAVTQGAEGLRIDHVGIVYKGSVIEATKEKGVTITPLDSFMLNNERHVVIARVKNVNTKKSIERALTFVGLPYDTLFMPDDKAIYCSELVQKSYVDDKDSLVFKPVPMSFHNEKGEITPFWKEFYRQYGMEVPEGWPGSNPGELSRCDNVTILRKW